MLTPNGGYIGESYMRHMDPETFKRQWRIDPFAFFSRALDVEDSPRPDCTTLNGNRIYSSSQATADVLDLTIAADRALRFRSEALGQATIVWANLPPRVDFAVRTEGTAGETVQTVRTDAEGRLRFTVPLHGPATISISPASGEGGD